MKITWRFIVSLAFYILGIIGWLYVGVWMTITRPMKGLIVAALAGELSLWKLLLAFAQSFLYLSLAGAVWCIGYMLSGRFRDDGGA
ncbi:MAG: phospho-N-acetylmuramoyl-pentapeptide-transferase [Clostridiales bacterium]|nr:phospho-N-acetylmuramoyl-pentapeptide-transferase [Clostridiales bacterium]